MIRPWPADDDRSEEAFAADETFQRVLRSADQVISVTPTVKRLVPEMCSGLSRYFAAEIPF